MEYQLDSWILDSIRYFDGISTGEYGISMDINWISIGYQLDINGYQPEQDQLHREFPGDACLQVTVVWVAHGGNATGAAASGVYCPPAVLSNSSMKSENDLLQPLAKCVDPPGIFGLVP